MLVWVGAAIAAFGWLFLLTGVTVAEASFARGVVNIHLMAIAQNVIYLGYVLVITGVIGTGFRKIQTYLSAHPDMATAINTQEPAPKPSVRSKDPMNFGTSS